MPMARGVRPSHGSRAATWEKISALTGGVTSPEFSFPMERPSQMGGALGSYGNFSSRHAECVKAHADDVINNYREPEDLALQNDLVQPPV